MATCVVKQGGGKNVTFGEFGLKALDSHWISNRQIGAGRIAITSHAVAVVRFDQDFPSPSYTSKGVGVRMGNGKGAPEGWVAPVKRGKVMFEVGGVSEEVAREALRLAGHKLPVRTKIVQREEVGGQSNEK